MRSSLEALEGNKVKLVVDIDEDEFERDLDAAFRRLAREVRLPGFRPGKAPRKVLEARIGQAYARDEAFREALPGYYSEAIKEHEVDVIAPPEIDITNGQNDGPVSFDAVVEVRPSITVEGYESLEIEIPGLDVTEEDIDESVDRMRAGFGTLETVDRPATEGDSAVIDIETFHEGEPVAGLTTEDYVYKIGSRAVVAEIDEELVGAEAGEELQFFANHPDEDEEEPLDITIKVKEVQQTALPEATDQWVAQNSEFETLAELRADFESNLRTQRINRAQFVRRTEIANAVAALVDDDLVPRALIDLEVENRAQDMAVRLAGQGVDLQSYLQVTGQSQEDLLAEMRTGATVSAKLDLALRAIAEAENLDVTDDDVEAELEKAATALDRPIDEVRHEFTSAGRMPALRSDLLKSKALDWVTERANLVDEDGRQLSPDALELPTRDERQDDTEPGAETTNDETTDDPTGTGEDET